MVKEERETAEFTLGGVEIKGKEIRSALDRHRMEYIDDCSDQKKKQESDYIQNEWKNCLIALSYYLPYSLVSNTPHKAYPLYRTGMIAKAKELGFKIPFTLVSNWPDSIKKHLFSNNSTGKITIQTTSYRPTKYPAYMTEMTEEDLEKNKEELAEFPSIYRKRINQLHDIRVYAIGNTLIGVKINSQENEETKIDWKKNPEYNMYGTYSVPKALGEKILKFQQLYEFTFSAYDFTVVDESKDPLFLEIDKSPDWLFIESRNPEIKITEEVIKLLEAGKQQTTK